MRLLECHIDNFGKLSDRDISFHEGTNVFLERNAWGKSTLATFIKVMLYGFDNETKRNEVDNERKKYRPWQKGIYGGTLTLEVDGKNYRIEKTFGAKPKDDLCVIRNADSNLVIPGLDASCIGQKYLKVDSASFQRSVYISQSDVKTKSTPGISAKIGRIADDTDDMNNYEKAVECLKNAINKMTPDRKTGDLYKKKQSMDDLSVELMQEGIVDNNLCRLQAEQREEKVELDKQTVELNEMMALQRELSVYGEKSEKKKRYEELLDTRAQKKAEYESAVAAFSGPLPEKTQTNTVKDWLSTLKTKEGEKTAYRLNDREVKELDELENVFRNGIPDENKLNDIKRKLDKAEVLRISIAESGLTEEEKNEWKAEESIFANHPIEETKDEINVKIRRWDDRKELKSSLGTRRVAAEMAKHAGNQTSSDGKAWLLLLAIGILIILAGVALLVLSRQTLGLISAVIGAAIVLMGFLLSRRSHSVKESSGSSQAYENLIEEIEKDERTIEEIESEIKRFLSLYQIEYQENDVSEKLYSLLNRLINYNKLDEKKRKHEDGSQETEYNDIIRDVRVILEQYHVQPNPDENKLDDNLQTLIERVDKYQDLKRKKDQYKELDEDAQSLKNDVKEFLDQSGIPFEKDSLDERFDELNQHLHTIQITKEASEEAEEALTKFCQKNPDFEMVLRLKKPDTEFSLEEINEKISSLTRSIGEKKESILSRKGQIEEEQQRYSELQEKKTEYVELKETYQEEEEYYNDLKKADSLLKQAKQSLTEKFADPIKKRFDHYYSVISGNGNDAFLIDAEAKITAKEFGQQRETEMLSTGYQDMIGICLRMAFADVMFPDEKPFLIFDDPFVNLDSEKIDHMKTFMEEVEKKYQIIYFTCHASRALS